MKIAVIGCSHGTLDDLYASVQKADSEGQARGEPPVELVICCGDFQAMRSLPDLESMACPVKYRALGQFHHYYAHRKSAPYLTIVIGGNHESSGYMWETFHGGWLAPSIYFLGFAGCVLVDGWLRIAGASGIYKSNDFRKGHFETVPFDDRTIRSVYHIREYDVARLLSLQGRGPNPDIFLSHDWPLGIEQHGDVAALIREKPFFRDEIQSNTLGSPPLDHLLRVLQPSYWFSAHLHVKFAALVHHDGRPTIVKGRGRPTPQVVQAAVEAAPNPDEIALEDDEDDEEPPTPAPEQAEVANEDEIMVVDEDEEDEPKGVFSEEKEGSGCECAGGQSRGHPHEEQVEVDGLPPVAEAKAAVAEEQAGPGPRTTKFLALSKPGHGKDFLQVLDIPTRPAIPRPEPPAPPAEPGPESTTDASPQAGLSKPVLYFDPHWLAVVRALHPSLSTSVQAIALPPAAQAVQLIDESYAWVKENVGKEGILPIEAVQTFGRTAPASGEGADHSPPVWYTNPQTEALCELLGLENRINPVPPGFKEAQAAAREAAQVAAAQAEDERKAALAEAKRAALAAMDDEPAVNEDEIAVDDDDDE